MPKAKPRKSGKAKPERPGKPPKPPTDIVVTWISAFADGVVPDDTQINTTLASLSASDPNAGDIFTFSEVTDRDNKFTIIGNQLILADVLTLADPEIAETHFVEVSVTDQTGRSYSETITVRVPRRYVPIDGGAIPQGWRTAKLGAGGQVTRIDIAPDGTMVCCGDVFGAWRWDRGQDKWMSLITPTSLPAGEVANGAADGVYDIRIAPSQTGTFYMILKGFMYRSVDSGQSWINQGTWTQIPNYANQSVYKLHGPKMAVSPNDPNLVIAGSVNGSVYITANGGLSSWSAISGIATTATDPQWGGKGYRVIFVSGTEALICSMGTGVYRSTNVNLGVSATWALTSLGPTGIKNWDRAADGAIWAVADSGTNQIWKFAGGAWTNYTNYSGNLQAPACHPTDPNKIFFMGDGGYTATYTSDGGANFHSPIADQTQIYIGDTSDDIPWIGDTNNSGVKAEIYLTTGFAKYHPITNELYHAMGVGVLYVADPITSGTIPIVLKSKSRGIEGLVANNGLSVPGGYTFLCCWDRPIFKIENPEIYAAGYLPELPSNAIYGSIRAGWSLDYASDDSSFLGALVNFGSGGAERSCKSSDGGATWTEFTGKPLTVGGYPGFPAGCLAVSTSLNMVWFPANEGPPYRTTDGGATWVKITFPAGIHDLPEGDWDGIPGGWDHADWANARPAVADKVTPNVFYAINYVTHRCYKSTDSGATWVAQGAGTFTNANGTTHKLYAFPFNAGYLIACAGFGDSSIAPSISFDGGATWSYIAGWTNAHMISFGKQIGNGFNPTVYILGTRSGVFGVYYSTDITAGTPTWTRLGTTSFPAGNLGYQTAIVADMNLPLRVYVGHSGFGWTYWKQ